VILSYLSKKYYQKLDGIVAVSNYTKRYLLKYYSKLKEKVRVITNGINFDQLFENPKSKDQVKKTILFVGQVKKRKGLLEAIEALKYYRDNLSNNLIFDFNIVGSYIKNDEYYRKLVYKLKEYKLGDENSFKGRVGGKDLHAYYRNADLLLMTSLSNHYFEGFGLVFLEANTKGTPVIGSRNSGCEDAILDEQTGYLVDPHNPKEVAEKIYMVLNRNTIQAENCIEWAKQNDIKIKTKELLNFYHGR
jgi:glycosyltransferase involved in cell wall biosynthesis